MGVSSGKIGYPGVDTAGLPAVVELNVLNGEVVGGGLMRSAVVDTSDNTTTVNAAATYLYGIYVNTALSAHTVVIKDGTTAVLTLPASTAAGTQINFYGRRFDTSLVVDPDDSSTGGITLFYRAA